MSEHYLYDNDTVLPDHYDIANGASVSAARIRELYAMVSAMQERGLVVIVRVMRDDDDDAGERLVFSTHPDTVAAETQGEKDA